MDFSSALNLLPIAQAQTQGQNDFWLSKWMSPFWFVGVGILAGLVALFVVILILKILSKVAPWERLSHSTSGHVVAGILSLAISFGLMAWVRGSQSDAQGKGVAFAIQNAFDSQENILLYLSVLLMSSIVGWSLVFCAGKQPAKNVFATLTEGSSSVLGFVVLVVMLIGLVSTFLVKDPVGALTSIPRLFETGEIKITEEVAGIGDSAPDSAPFKRIDLPIDVTLLRNFAVSTTGTVVFADADDASQFQYTPYRLQAGDTLTWNRQTDGAPKIEIEPGKLYVQNREVDPTRIDFTLETRPAVPEASTILISALCILLTGLIVMLQQAVAPRASAVALATIKNELAQPLFTVLLLLGAFAIVLFVFLSFNTFGEDIKLLKDCGITVIMLLAAFQGIWSASSSISEEIEGRTALTVLSKPIQRRSFVIGKFLGIFWVVALLFVVLGAIELGAVAYKPIYEARENSLEPPVWQDCHREMMSTIPGLALGLMQATVLSAISVALATRLPQLANISVCFGIYVVGHLATAIVSGANQGFEIVKFVAQLVSTIIPILEHFSMQAAIDSGSPITISLLSGTLVYCLLYVLLSMFLALLLFEDRDLA